MSVSASSVSTGGNVTYTLTVGNNGPADVAGAMLTDVAPAGVTFGTWTCAVTTPGAGTVTTACGAPAGNGNVNTTVTLNRGGGVTYTIAASVAANASGTLTNVASVNAPAGITDPVSANNSGAASVNVQVAPPPPPPMANPQAIPTLSEWALMLLALMMFGVAGHALRGRVPRR